MASIFRKKRSPFWFAAYRDATGNRRQKSTKLRDRNKAMRISLEWERLASAGRAGVLSEAECRKVVSELHEQVTGTPIQFYTIKGWFTEWIANCRGTTAVRTLTRYKATCDDFLAALGDRSKLPLAALSDADVRKYRDAMRAEGRSGPTCNQEVKILRMPLERAKRMGLIAMNAAAVVDALKDDAPAQREAFTERQIAALLTGTKGNDWHGCIMFGALCGLRLMDAANLKWGNIDLGAAMLTTTTGKRGVKVQVPLHPALIAWLKSRSRGIGTAPVLPALHGKSGAGKSGLSMSFKRIMAKAGIVGETARRGHGRGRTTSTLSFHSTRHFFISALSAGGVASDTRQRLAGHTDAKSHAVYSKSEIESLRSAIAALPDVGERRR